MSDEFAGSNTSWGHFIFPLLIVGLTSTSFPFSDAQGPSVTGKIQQVPNKFIKFPFGDL